MLKPGSGFFAMWNGIAPEFAERFALMHARDHLGEHLSYLGEEGILWARRHGEGQGALPPFFAFYAMASLDRLVAPGAASHQVHETALFKAMREHYRDRIAHHCRVLASAGAGTGGAVATFLVTLTAGAADAAAELADRLTRLAAVTAAHIGAVDWNVPVRAGGVPPTCPPGQEHLGVVVIESYSRFALARSLDEIAGLVGASGVAAALKAAGHYGLSYALTYGEVAGLRYHRRDQPAAPAEGRS
ncbi:hypothetical protein [Bosea sp. (in: a-proteobacteria)]|jgi:hypothetical protein|uniref:hypothetical protein n=1 Tax=Bosea sp. (in: a-proteobacteria) TaxID=1871050 RepID=UPI003F6E8A80